MQSGGEVTVVCATCATQFAFPRSAIGTTARCEKCGRQIEISIAKPPNAPCTKRREAIDYFLNLGGELDATSNRRVKEVRFADGRVVNANLLESLSFFPNVHTLWVYRTSLTDADMKVLARVAPSLSDVSIVEGSVTDLGIDALSGHELRRLVAPKNRIQGKCLRHFPHLKELVLSDNPVVSESLSCLTQLVRSELQIEHNYPALRNLALENTQIDDNAVDTLIELSVRDLRVSGTRITDEGLCRLGANPRWNVMTIEGPMISIGGRLDAWLKSAMHQHRWREWRRKGIYFRLADNRESLRLVISGEADMSQVMESPWRGYIEHISEVHISSKRISDALARKLKATLPESAAFRRVE